MVFIVYCLRFIKNKTSVNYLFIFYNGVRTAINEAVSVNYTIVVMGATTEAGAWYVFLM